MKMKTKQLIENNSMVYSRSEYCVNVRFALEEGDVARSRASARLKDAGLSVYRESLRGPLTVVIKCEEDETKFCGIVPDYAGYVGLGSYDTCRMLVEMLEEHIRYAHIHPDIEATIVEIAEYPAVVAVGKKQRFKANVAVYPQDVVSTDEVTPENIRPIYNVRSRMWDSEESFDNSIDVANCIWPYYVGGVCGSSES